MYLGMRAGDLDGMSYERFWSPRMAPLAAHAQSALLAGPVPAPLLPRLGDDWLVGEQETENGFGRDEDGGIVVALRTELPDVTPAMIDWWFAWHGEDARRYKLWHPRAHVHAAWSAPGQGYVGRVSRVCEYIGGRLERAEIAFVAPATLGLAGGHAGAHTAVCARIGIPGVHAGHLVHHVRTVPGGSEMRSRFWLGGRDARVLPGSPLARFVTPLARRILRPTLSMARDLLVHCSEEMSHLATFLPALYCAMIPASSRG